MARSSFTFTSESVSEGHPDKVADQISDTVVDFMLARDAQARIACETMVTTQRIFLAGEIRCNGVFDLDAHPDKVCDRISDTIVDAFLAAEPEARVAAETLATTNRVVIAGETRGPASVNNELIEHLTRQAIRDIGY